MTELPPLPTPSTEAPPAGSEPTPSTWASYATAAIPRGPVEGLVYAGVLRRLIALGIDVLLSTLFAGVAGGILNLVWSLVGGDTGEVVFGLVSWLVAWIAFGAYYVLGWRQRRGTLGQRWLGMQVANADSGATLTWRQAVMRWVAFSLAPVAILQGFASQPVSGLVSLVVLGWAIVLLITTITSPTRQGLHDRWAASLVVRRA
jgi:uncharacterized RDD family membrane protein YckC